MKRFSKFIVWIMSYIGCTFAIRSVSDSNVLLFIIEFLGVISFFVWAFSDNNKSSGFENDTDAIIFTKEDIKHLVENDAIVMTTRDGAQIYFMSEECYEKSYKDS